MIFLGYEYSDDEIEWRKIHWKNGEETKYSVSNIGLVRNDNRNKILKYKMVKGYYRVGLTHKGKNKEFLIHRLVAKEFIPNPENKAEVNHINGNKSCNCVFNLEWTTRTENQQHAVKNGLISTGAHERLTKKQIKKICKLLEANELTFVKIAKVVGCSRQAVSCIYHKKQHTDISHNYNIDNYEKKVTVVQYGDDSPVSKYSDEDIHKVCKLIDSGKYELPEISKITNIPYQTIRNVYYGTCRRDISKNYNFMKTDKNPLIEQKKLVVVKVCELLDEGYNTREVANQLNIKRSFVRAICSGCTWFDISKNYNFMKSKKNIQ